MPPSEALKSSLGSVRRGMDVGFGCSGSRPPCACPRSVGLASSGQPRLRAKGRATQIHEVRGSGALVLEDGSCASRAERLHAQRKLTRHKVVSVLIVDLGAFARRGCLNLPSPTVTLAVENGLLGRVEAGVHGQGCERVG